MFIRTILFSVEHLLRERQLLLKSITVLTHELIQVLLNRGGRFECC